jgi:hypothetical protein
MADDRLKKDFDQVENLSDLIKAREERESAISDDLDAMEDFDTAKLPVDANTELTWPHPRTRSDEDGELGLNVELMDTPDESQMEFDWQDSAEEMLATDPEENEGMGEDIAIGDLGHMNSEDLSEDEERFGTDGGEPKPPTSGIVPLETAMDTDSDEADFSIEDKFAGQLNHETAEYDFELIREQADEDHPELQCDADEKK